MKLNSICRFLLILPVYFFIPLFFISAERLETFLIVPTEYSDDSVSTYSPSDKKLILEDIQNEIYSVFKHYSSGNAEKGNDAESADMKRYRIVKSLVKLCSITESEKGGFFCETELILFEKGNEDQISMKYTAFGKTEDESFRISVSRLSEQIKFSYSDFDEKSGFFRILDIYQNEIIVSCGKNEGFSKGDYLEILDSSTGRAEGRIILTASDEKISYGRLLYWNPDNSDSVRPAAGLKVRKIKYLGLDTSVSAEYLLDDLYTGSGINFRIEYFRSLYIFHPFISASLYNIESSIDSSDLNLLSAGIAMRRHSGKISLCSAVSLIRGSFREGNMKSADFKGGRISAGIEYSLLRHLGIFAEGGYMQLFAEEDAASDMGGFLFGGGLSFKY